LAERFFRAKNIPEKNRRVVLLAKVFCGGMVIRLPISPISMSLFLYDAIFVLFAVVVTA